MKLEDLKIIVTGGAQGMGRTFALELAEAGASVVIADVNEAGLAETLEASKGKRGKVFAKKTNVAEESANMTRYNILTQSGIAALSQANQASQSVLSLLR